ncbi:MAG TPA: carbonic anhydrase [Candidatus Sulfotelmatobacter sp.]|nr:carbonic anhydrase [Candidatus Sulfotelmatobacter sp.]
MATDPPAALDVPPGPPADALQKLTTGNVRFQGGRATRRYPDYQGPYAEKQHPYAAVLACADSRVAPESVFDEGLDKLFVCRVAGNTADDVVIGSLEYAVTALGVSLVAVVGHSACGACDATLDSLNAGVLPGGSLGSVVRAILPATAHLDRRLPPDQQLRALIASNAQLTATTLSMNPVLRAARQARTLGVVWGVQDLRSGLVSWGPTPAG